MDKLYHGSNIPNLKTIVPNRSGYVHTTTELVFALIFSSRERNSLNAKWGMNEDNIPYFCEKMEGIFDRLFKNKSSHIYILDKKDFFPNDRTWKYEYLSNKEEKVIEELVINDIRDYLLNMEKEGKFQLIKYKDRKKYFPNIDNEDIKIALDLAKKYGKDRAIHDCEKWRPDILEDLRLELDKQE